MYTAVRQVTKMELDRSSLPTPLGEEAFESIRVNFNISVLRIPCQYASLQVADHVGSHKMGGARNTHKVRLDTSGMVIGMYQPHKYNDDNSNLAEHVFPWHKQMHTQGDAEQRKDAARQHLSPEQAKVISQAEETMKRSSGGKQGVVASPVARKLLSLARTVDSLPSRSQRRTPYDGHVRRSPVSRRLLSAAEPQPAASASPAHAADASFGLADLHADCASWADKGECTHNSAFMVFKCQSSCALKADADACKAWAAEGRCKDALNFMHAACAGVCEPPTAVAPAPSGSVQSEGAASEGAAVGHAEAAEPKGTAAADTAAGTSAETAATSAAASAHVEEAQAASATASIEAVASAAATGEAAAMHAAAPGDVKVVPAVEGTAAEAATAEVIETAEAKPSAESNAVATAEANAGEAVKGEPHAETESDAQADAKPDAQADAQADAKPDAQADAQAEAQAEAQAADANDTPSEATEHDSFVPEPFDESPAQLSEAEFEALVRSRPAVMVNFFAPWCFWSAKLTPAWIAVARRLNKRAYSQSISFIQIDCTKEPAKGLCQHQSVHAYPSVRSYRGSIHAFEPYEYGRDENVIWLHLVKLAAEAVVARLQQLPPEEREPYGLQISHISEDLMKAMERREQGLDEDWTDDALSTEEEVAEDRELLEQMNSAAASIFAAKGEHGGRALAEPQAVRDRSSDLVLSLLRADRKDADPDGAPLETWHETETHEGCMLFGYVDVSRAPGTIHIAPHSPRHSFDFSTVNTSHLIDHLSFGLELIADERAALPPEVRRHLMSLDGQRFITTQPHETQEHHVNIVPTSFRRADSQFRTETFQFTATSHARTKDTLPSLLISYDVSPIQVQISLTHTPLIELLVSLCAIIGGAFTIFGVLDGILFNSGKALGKKLA